MMKKQELIKYIFDRLRASSYWDKKENDLRRFIQAYFDNSQEDTSFDEIDKEKLRKFCKRIGDEKGFKKNTQTKQKKETKQVNELEEKKETEKIETVSQKEMEDIKEVYKKPSKKKTQSTKKSTKDSSAEKSEDKSETNSTDKSE